MLSDDLSALRHRLAVVWRHPSIKRFSLNSPQIILDGGIGEPTGYPSYLLYIFFSAESTILGSLDENTIGALDPEKAMLLRPWLQLSHTTELPAHFADSFWQHVVLHFDTEPSGSWRRRSKEDHVSLSSDFASYVLLGHKQAIRTPEFTAIRAGFNLSWHSTTAFFELFNVPSLHTALPSMPTLVSSKLRPVEQPWSITFEFCPPSLPAGESTPSASSEV
ncbi:hypothetical protein EW026_g1716 [Hermanssonia centrifuga]|uniref:Uncharacterized protein n=1 Tax=Hermanssonia centrifuga TaxID=98765 RepID=A0A4S4KQF4_9APHY|nr:hypothetical protein EW026_g1716 [Hermanssonia centrifuga]